MKKLASRAPVVSRRSNSFARQKDIIAKNNMMFRQDCFRSTTILCR
jgi:hypothetical protein